MNILPLYFKSCLASKLACISFSLKELSKSPWAESEGHILPFPHLQFFLWVGESVKTKMFLWNILIFASKQYMLMFRCLACAVALHCASMISGSGCKSSPTPSPVCGGYNHH